MKQACTKPVTFKNLPPLRFWTSWLGARRSGQRKYGWRGGGYNQESYCGDLTAASVAARRLGGTAYSISRIGNSEEGRWAGGLQRRREYNYHCSIKISWDPIYNERRDERCGVIN